MTIKSGSIKIQVQDEAQMTFKSGSIKIQVKAQIEAQDDYQVKLQPEAQMTSKSRISQNSS